jgi:hypothetical protein
MSMSMTVFASAAGDAERESAERLFTALRISAGEYWGFVAQASSDSEFESRLALIETGLHGVTASLLDDTTSNYYASLRNRLETEWREDFTTVHTERVKAHRANLQRQVFAELKTAESDKYPGYNENKPDVDPNGDYPGWNEWDPEKAIDDKTKKQSSRKTSAWKREDLDNGDYYTPIDGLKLDNVTRAAIKTVHDALSPENQAKFTATPIDKAADIAWKLISKHSSLRTKAENAAGSDGPDGDSETFLSGPAEGQSGPASGGETPGSGGEDNASGDGPTMDESAGNLLLPDETVVNKVSSLHEVPMFMTREAAAAFTRQHYNHIAEGIRTAPVDDETRELLAKHFAGHLGGTNPGFNPDRFVGAATHTSSRRPLGKTSSGDDYDPELCHGAGRDLRGSGKETTDGTCPYCNNKVGYQADGGQLLRWHRKDGTAFGPGKTASESSTEEPNPSGDGDKPGMNEATNETSDTHMDQYGKQ